MEEIAIHIFTWIWVVIVWIATIIGLIVALAIIGYVVGKFAMAGILKARQIAEQKEKQNEQ